MVEFIFEIIGEFLLQIVGEALLELGFHTVASPFQRSPTPYVAALAYTVFGVAVGGLSLLIFPHNLVAAPWRVFNLILTPLAAGACMAVMGAWRRRRGQTALRIDRFSYGYVFALALALIRFRFAL